MKTFIYRLYILFFMVTVLSIAPTTLSAATRIKGDLSKQSFSRAGSPYLVIEDIHIPEKGRVVIPAGVVILFSNLSGCKVMGSLSVEGTEDASVIFSSMYDGEYIPDAPHLANPDDWSGIFVGQQANNVVFRNFELKFSTLGITSKNPDIIIENGRFKRNTKNVDIEGITFPPIKDDELFSSRPQSEPPSNISVTADSSPAATEPPQTAAISAQTPLTSNSTDKASLQAALSPTPQSGKIQQGTTPAFSPMMGDNPSRDLIVFNKRVKLSILGALAVGGLTSWIVNHLNTTAHIRNIADYEKTIIDPRESPPARQAARDRYNEEYDQLSKSINRVYFSAAITIGICTGIGLTLAF